MSLAVQSLFSGVSCGGSIEVGGAQVPRDYGDPAKEYRCLTQTLGVADLGFRSRLCLLGEDRKRFLHGQVTNNVNDLAVGQGCYAALVTAKGRMQSDLFIYQLANEILLDFEPGLTAKVTQRLEQYVIADDVQIVDVASSYSQLTVQGPLAGAAMEALSLGLSLPGAWLQFTSVNHPAWGELYCMNQPRGNAAGFDIFVPVANVASFAERLAAVAEKLGGCICGWDAMEIVRIEAGLPRFGADMDETNLAPETGIETRAISYNKGCYIGQEVIARIRTYGQVAKALRGLKLAEGPLPKKGDKLFAGEKEVGYITSASISPAVKGPVALGYVRREQNAEGTHLEWRGSEGGGAAEIVKLPFVSSKPPAP